MSRSVEQLPDNILLHIFSYLCVKELCITGRVNRRWRRILRDKSLWRHVSLLPYRLDLQKMWKVIRSHLSDCLLSIKVRGFVDKGGPNWNKHTISPAILQDLCERCPNLKQLEMHYCNIDNIECSMLPTSLTTLVFRGCFWPCHWLQHDAFKHLCNLTALDVSGTKRIDAFDIEDICKLKSLKVLRVNGCYRIIPHSLEAVCTGLTELEVMDFGNTGLKDTDLAIHHLTRNLGKLKHLNLSGCPGLKSCAIKDILVSLKHLEYLNVAKCKNVSAEDLIKFASAFKTLKTVVLDQEQIGTNYSEELLATELLCTVAIEM